MAESCIPGPAPATVTEYDYERAFVVEGDVIVTPPSGQKLLYADSSGLQFKVRAGWEAKVHGTLWTSGDTDLVVAVSANSSGSDRIDRVVLQLDRSTSLVTVEVVEGVGGAGYPALTQSEGPASVYQWEVGYVTVPSGAATIASGNVTNRNVHVLPTVIADGYNVSDENIPQICLRWIDDDSKLRIQTDGENISGALDIYADTGWLAFTPSLSGGNGWSAGIAQYRKLSGVVYVEIILTRVGATLNANADSQLGQLGTGYRPSFQIARNANVWTSSATVVPAIIRVDTDGKIVLTDYISNIAAGKNVYCGFSYPVGNAA